MLGTICARGGAHGEWYRGAEHADAAVLFLLGRSTDSWMDFFDPLAGRMCAVVAMPHMGVYFSERARQ